MRTNSNVYTPAGQPAGGDWSGEITPASASQSAAGVRSEGGARPGAGIRPASDTGLGGIAPQPEPLEPIGYAEGPAAGARTPAAGENGGRSAMMSGAPLPAPPRLAELRSGLPQEVITSPLTTQEAYLGSLKAMLSRYVGSYIVATFLVGTQYTVSWDGVLFDVGNDYLTIYQEPRDRYIVGDYYSLKFIEFYDVERRRRCMEMLEQNEWRDQGR